MTKWLYVPDRTKKNVYEQIAEATGMSSFAVEKDWWVSRTLGIIFQMDIAKHLVFKGGTSLSKAWKLIHRFSEDIDLAIDRDYFEGYNGVLSGSKISRLRKVAGAYSTGTFFKALKHEFETRGFKDLQFKILNAKDSDQDPRVIEIYYSNIIAAPTEYLLPRIQVEIGCRSLREPFSMQSFGSLVDEVYASTDFAEPLFAVPSVNPERTLLEKLFLLHEEFHRPIEKRRVDRLSRHLYDIYHLTKAGIAARAISDKELYETIVAHRYKFSRVGGVDYNGHSPGMLDPVPLPATIDKWKSDYNKMVEEMIYETNAPTFDQLIDNLNVLKLKLKNVNWKFELEFPLPQY